MTTNAKLRYATPSTSAPVDARMLALEDAVDQAVLAPSVHNTQPWLFVPHPDRLEVRANRSRQLTAVDPLGRELVQSVGAALLNARVALSARGWAVEVERLPRAADPELMAVVYPVAGPADPALADLYPMIARRRTNRRRFQRASLADVNLDRLGEIAGIEDVILIPLAQRHRRLVASMTWRADRIQNADPAYRAELRTWTTRTTADGDGIVATTVPHVDGTARGDVPLRDFDTQGKGALPAETHSGVDQTMVLLATHGDDPHAWLRSGEALERLLLELTRRDCVASPITQAIEVPLTRRILRMALTRREYPQTLLRIGRAEPTPATPRRRRGEVVENSTRAPEPALTPPGRARTQLPPWPDPSTGDQASRPVSDGRGGSTWL